MISILIALVVLGVVISVVRWAFGGSLPPMDGSMMAGVATALGIALMVLFGLAVAGIALWAIFTMSPLAHSGTWGGPKDWSTCGAVSELKKRYARGVISRDEYFRTLQDLEGPPGQAAPPAAPAPPPAPPMQGPAVRQL